MQTKRESQDSSTLRSQGSKALAISSTVWQWSALQTSAADCAILVLFQSRFPPARHGLAKNDQRSLAAEGGYGQSRLSRLDVNQNINNPFRVAFNSQQLSVERGF